MYEVFSGNRILAYCFMSNHIHLLLEVTPAPPDGLTDEELLRRLRAINSEAQVAEVAKELAEAREAVAEGKSDESRAAAIHARFTYRMHDLGESMKTLLARFTRWFNLGHQRTGALWESRFKSVLVEEGVTSRTMAAARTTVGCASSIRFGKSGLGHEPRLHFPRASLRVNQGKVASHHFP